MMRSLTLLLLTFCICVTGLTAQAAEQQASEAQLKKLNKQIKSLTKRLTRNEKKANKLTSALQKSEQEISVISLKVDNLDQHLGSLINNGELLKQKRERLTQGLATRKKVIEIQIVQQLKLGRQPRIELLLNLQSPDQVSRQLRYFDNINHALATQLTEYRNMLEELGNTHVAIGQNSQEMIEQRLVLNEQHKKLANAQQKRKKTLALIRKRIKKDKTRLHELKIDQEKMEILVAELRKMLDLTKLASTNQNFKTQKGKLPWPISGKVIRRFGNKINGVSFDGMWISGKSGKAVKAVHGGRVVFSDWLRSYGMVTIIDHGNNYMSLYGYNQSLLRAPGDWVSAGDAIATVGNSGGHKRAGLYFAIRYNSRSSNPSRWLAKP